VPQHGGALRVAGVVVGNWSSSKEDSYVKVVDHLTAKSAPPSQLQLLPQIAAITYVHVPCILSCMSSACKSR